MLWRYVESLEAGSERSALLLKRINQRTVNQGVLDFWGKPFIWVGGIEEV
jgi:hypothetical protein